MATSQNGWPVLEANSSKLYTWVIPAKDGDTRIRLRNGSAGFVLAHFALWYSEVIEPLKGKVLDDWGWAPRPIRGSTVTSNHASGTAIDLNATKHPLGAVGTLSAKVRVGGKAITQSVRIKARLAFYAGCIRAGAFYVGRKDEMHYELVKDLPAVERLARRLMRTPRGKRLLKANPGQRAVILS